MGVPSEGDVPPGVEVVFEPGRVFASLAEWAEAAVDQAPPLSDAQCAGIRWALAPAVDAVAARDQVDTAA